MSSVISTPLVPATIRERFSSLWDTLPEKHRWILQEIDSSMTLLFPETAVRSLLQVAVSLQRSRVNLPSEIREALEAEDYQQMLDLNNYATDAGDHYRQMNAATLNTDERRDRAHQAVESMLIYLATVARMAVKSLARGPLEDPLDPNTIRQRFTSLWSNLPPRHRWVLSHLERGLATVCPESTVEALLQIDVDLHRDLSGYLQPEVAEAIRDSDYQRLLELRGLGTQVASAYQALSQTKPGTVGGRLAANRALEQMLMHLASVARWWANRYQKHSAC